VESRAFSWEVKDIITQFIAAFDDVVIGRYNRDREEQDKVEVGYIYQPKRRVIHDLQNRAQNLKLPMGAIVINSISRNSERAFNKVEGFTYPGVRDPYKPGPNSVKIPPVVPIDISVTLSLIASYQTDMDQIISNFAAYANPYIMITWKVPTEFGLPDIMPINTKVEWDGNIALDYPVDVTHSERSVITADANFTIQGWLFKDSNLDPVKNIFFIDANFHNNKILSAGNFIGYDDYAALSGYDYNYSEGEISITDVDVASVSGSPTLTNIFYSVSGKDSFPILNQGYTINDPGTIIVYGKRFNETTNVLLSSSGSTVYGSLTSLTSFDYFPDASGAILPDSSYRVITDNVMEIYLPALSSGTFDILVTTPAGWDTSYSAMSGNFTKQ